MNKTARRAMSNEQKKDRRKREQQKRAKSTKEINKETK